MKTKSVLLIMLLLLSTISTVGLVTVSADTPLQDFPVSSDGTAVYSMVLEFGKLYQIVATEVFSPGPGYEADAMYYGVVPPSWNWAGYLVLPSGHSFLQIDGNDVNWGPFSNGDAYHTYSINTVGDGNALMFQIHDWLDENYANNYCHIRVRIYELPDQFYGLTPGFWKNHLDAWVGYDPSDGVCSVFSEASSLVSCSDSLLDALRYPGGKGAEGAARILLRAAVAALLNAEHPDINYPETSADIIDMVNAALASGKRGVMIDLAAQLDDYNNYGVPWD